MSKFKSLAAELEGHYGKSEHHLPDDLRDRVRWAFAAFYPWNVLSSDQRRDWASRWWRGRAAFQEDDQGHPELDEQYLQSGWDSIEKPKALERQILEWEATSAPTPTELEKKELRLAQLRRELASLIAGRPTSTVDEPQEQSVAPAKDAPADAGERTAQPRRTTPDQMCQWMLQIQRDLKDAGKLHGRDIILAAARKHFRVVNKVALDAWNARLAKAPAGKPPAGSVRKSP